MIHPDRRGHPASPTLLRSQGTLHVRHDLQQTHARRSPAEKREAILKHKELEAFLIPLQPYHQTRYMTRSQASTYPLAWVALRDGQWL